jgi:hypothetical protein
MLTQLTTIKTRLVLTDTQFDEILTNAIAAVSARFDKECHRIFARTEDFKQEFDPSSSDIIAACYPIEIVTNFELKFSEGEGRIEQPMPEYLVRSGCVISLAAPWRGWRSRFAPVGRVTYTGGYVLPGDADVASAIRLPADIEQAAVEQVAFWFQSRDHAGVIREWPKGGTYQQFADLDLLPSVRAVLAKYERIVCS